MKYLLTKMIIAKNVKFMRIIDFSRIDLGKKLAAGATAAVFKSTLDGNEVNKY